MINRFGDRMELYVVRSSAYQAVYDLAGRPLALPRPGQSAVDAHIAWHNRKRRQDELQLNRRALGGTRDRLGPVTVQLGVLHEH